MKQEVLARDRFRLRLASRINIVAILVGAAALMFATAQVQAGDKNVVPSQQPTFNIAPQMIGDLSFGFNIGEFAPTNPFKIAENESPRPINRVFLTYNYFNDVTLGHPIPDLQTDLHREVIGFEKTFLNGDASVGLRLPFFQVHASDPTGSENDSSLGDLNLIFKYAFINDRTNGNIFSAGLSITLPTASGDTEFRDGKLQPYIGGIYNMGNFYIHGFSSVAVPTDSDDTTMLFNDLGIGYFVYQNPTAFISKVVPTFEVHINTPLNHRDEPVPNIVDLTQGLHFEFNGQAWITVGVVEPVTSPKPFEIEGIAQFNFRF